MKEKGTPTRTHQGRNRNYQFLVSLRKYKKAGVAQTVEQLPCKQTVEGATPFTGSKIFAKL